MKKHIKLFEEFGQPMQHTKAKNRIVAGLAYKSQGGDMSDAGSFRDMNSAKESLIEMIHDARFEEFDRGLAYIVIQRGGGWPTPEFDTAMGEVLLEGDFDEVLMLDVAETENATGGQYTQDGRIVSKQEAIDIIADL